jgi:hypothetical protein
MVPTLAGGDEVMTRDKARLDLLNEPIPPEWYATRHCPTCSGTELRVHSDEVELGRWCSTYCVCGRLLRQDFIDGRPAWEDPEWIKRTEQ